eukprot:11225-Hanusia_phi.AAC.1
MHHQDLTGPVTTSIHPHFDKRKMLEPKFCGNFKFRRVSLKSFDNGDDDYHKEEELCPFFQNDEVIDDHEDQLYIADHYEDELNIHDEVRPLSSNIHTYSPLPVPLPVPDSVTGSLILGSWHPRVSEYESLSLPGFNWQGFKLPSCERRSHRSPEPPGPGAATGRAVTRYRSTH